MAGTKLPFNSLSLFFTFLLATLFFLGLATHQVPPPQGLSSSPRQLLFQNGMMVGRSSRALIGSTAPTCTYNECRGCKYRCRAEQIPVDANDPINSAYHYRCVCHK